MPSTGRLFMRIDSVVDERRDPLLSSRAAARFLRQNFDRLGTWPLAITAYNHGPAGVARAVRQTGTQDITTIVRKYKSRTFKFASRNFYPEFLAALEVERNHQKYFGTLKLQNPIPFDLVQPPHFIDLDVLARCAGVDEEAVVALNPQFSRELRAGKQRVPKGYAVRVPLGSGAVFHERYAALPAAQKFDEQKRLYVVHRVRRGQTLGAIARRYGSSVERISSYNGIRNAHMIRAGHTLRIPTGSTVTRRNQSYVVHRVRRGQTLAAIARRYGSSVERIKRVNGLRNKHRIQAGQELRIPVS
jgi:membrane-bound lytic murein transglycosylase D